MLGNMLVNVNLNLMLGISPPLAPIVIKDHSLVSMDHLKDRYETNN